MIGRLRRNALAALARAFPPLVDVEAREIRLRLAWLLAAMAIAICAEQLVVALMEIGR